MTCNRCVCYLGIEGRSSMGLPCYQGRVPHYWCGTVLPPSCLYSAGGRLLNWSRSLVLVIAEGHSHLCINDIQTCMKLSTTFDSIPNMILNDSLDMIAIYLCMLNGLQFVSCGTCRYWVAVVRWAICMCYDYILLMWWHGACSHQLILQKLLHSRRVTWRCIHNPKFRNKFPD